MRKPKSVLGTVLLGAGLFVLLACGKKDERPPPVDEGGDTGGEGAAGAGEGAAGTTGGGGAAGELARPRGLH